MGTNPITTVKEAEMRNKRNIPADTALYAGKQGDKGSGRGLLVRGG